MNSSEKAFARHLFQNKIYRADGQKFEDLFTKIMRYFDPNFQAIKPWGNIGDRKNDGYNKSKGIYYQVFAPEDIRKSYPDVIAKLKVDFKGLQSYWNPIKEFHFVVNDKYKGVNADCERTMEEIKNSYGLRQASFLTAKHLENMLFSLDIDQIVNVTGFIPDLATIQQLDYSVLNEVIGHIMNLPISHKGENKLTLPDWGSKLVFNCLSDETAELLENGFYQRYSLDDYLASNGDFLADSLRDQMNNIYIEQEVEHSGDDLFWAIVNYASPRQARAFQTTVIIIMAKYFETCDVFKEPPQNQTG